MAVQGKRKYTVYLNEESANLVRKYVELHEGSLSEFLNESVVRFARVLKREGFEELLGRIDTMSFEEYRFLMVDFLTERMPPREKDFPPVLDEEQEGE
jgi:hypothetical protein